MLASKIQQFLTRLSLARFWRAFGILWVGGVEHPKPTPLGTPLYYPVFFIQLLMREAGKEPGRKILNSTEREILRGKYEWRKPLNIQDNQFAIYVRESEYMLWHAVLTALGY